MHLTLILLVLVLTFVNCQDGRCGRLFENFECVNGECCSASGWCGTTDDHCGTGCQSNCGIVTTISKCTQPGKVVLSFDDGVHASTSSVLSILKMKKAKAIFFVNGIRSSSRRVLRRIFADGHEIGDHSWSHKVLPSLPDQELVFEITSTSNLVKNLTGVTPKYFRPPYLAYNKRVDDVVKKYNQKTIMVNLDTLDYTDGTSIQDIINRISSEITGKSSMESYIILFHCSIPNTINALPGVIDAIVSNGYKIVSVGECVM
jgi:peptidoglycan/xylan/chitin deacetylase (PgdA/CDA1 family)